MFETWLIAFVLTLLVEVPIVAAVARRAEPSLARRVGFGVFASLATHPAVWYVFPDLPIGPWTSLALSEAFAVVVEALFYALAFPRLGRGRAAALAIGANAASFGVGWVATEWLRLF